jgi:DNA invertase Pin-like site-specific DNA recombinase
VFHVFAALAEFERDLIRERTSAGLAAARARSRHGGRPSVLLGHKLQVAQEMYRSGQYTVAAIATTLGSAGPRSTATSTPPANLRGTGV